MPRSLTVAARIFPGLTAYKFASAFTPARSSWGRSGAARSARCWRWAAPEVEQTYTQARELCQQVGETAQLFPVLWGLWVFHDVRAKFQKSHELGEQLLTLAQRMRDPALLPEAHVALWKRSCISLREN